MHKGDIIETVFKVYSNIDVTYRRAFWVIFSVLCFVFGFHTIQFMWGNHDWEMCARLQNWGEYTWIGRYALTSFKKIFLNSIYLPIINDVVTFLFLSLNAVLLCVYWKLPKRIAYLVLCGLILTVQPFTLALMWFVHMIPETFVGASFALTALIISEKTAFGQASLMRKVGFTILSILLINLSLAMYPVLLNIITVAFVGRLLVQSFEWDGSWEECKSHFAPFAVSVLNIVLGVLSYKVMLTWVFQPAEFYNTQTLSLDRLPERLLILLKQSFHQLYEYNYPFISQAVLWVFLCFTILVALYICLTGNFKQKIVRLILLGGALYATQTAMIIANTHMIAARVELFGLVVFETLMAVLIFTKLKKIHNLTVIVTTGVIWVSVINDLDCLRVWKLGFDAEKMLWNRVLARMEEQTGFNAYKKYKIIQVGLPISMRPRFYEKSLPSVPFHDWGFSLLTASYDFPAPGRFCSYEFYYPTAFRDGERFHPDIKNTRYKAQLKRLWEAGVLDRACAWPHKNGIIVWKDIILFITDAVLLEKYKKQLAQEFPRQIQKTP